MGNIFYFLPGEKRADHDTITKHGLGYVLPEKTEQPDQQAVTNGPNKQSGIVFTFQGADNKAHLSMQEKADWKQIPKSEAWCGIYSGCVPGPDDLKREQAIAGFWVKLHDGNQWYIPSVCCYDGSTCFERPLKWDGEKFFYGDIEDRHKELYDAVVKMWDSVVVSDGDSGIVIKTTENAMACFQALAINYRIGPHEISELGILTTKNYRDAMEALMGLPILAELKKKADTDGRDGMHGGAK